MKRVNIDRYDDRDDIRVNLIESYERLTEFVNKHLNNPFYLEGDKRISLRDKIFREVISNMLIHREFSNSYPAKLIIDNNQVIVENGNRPHMNGLIDPNNYSPFPKNPTLARFFKEIGLVDELGSGVRNVNKYNLLYSGSEATFEEGDVFKTTIPLSMNNEDTNLEMGVVDKILIYCKEPRSRSEIQEFLGLNDREYFRKSILKPMIAQGLLKLTMPDKPTSPKQRYYS